MFSTTDLSHHRAAMQGIDLYALHPNLSTSRGIMYTSHPSDDGVDQHDDH